MAFVVSFMTIAIICPTKGRSQQCKRMVESVINTTSTHVTIYLLIQSQKDKEDYDMLGMADLLTNTKVTVFNSELKSNDSNAYLQNVPTAYLWNKLALQAYMKDAAHSLFMLGADDMIFSTVGWDTKLLNHYNLLEDKTHVYHLQDSRDSDGTPHPFVTREYIDIMGYFLPPIFLHWFVDSWTVQIAKRNTCFTHLKDFLLVHEKPKASDETYDKIRQLGWHARDEYINEKCQHFLEHEVKRLAETNAMRHW